MHLLEGNRHEREGEPAPSLSRSARDKHSASEEMSHHSGLAMKRISGEFVEN